MGGPSLRPFEIRRICIAITIYHNRSVLVVFIQIVVNVSVQSSVIKSFPCLLWLMFFLNNYFLSVPPPPPPYSDFYSSHFFLKEFI